MSLVSSHNEWDPLEEVIVGSVKGAAEFGYEPARAPYHPLHDPDRHFEGAPFPPEDIDRAERQLDAFAARLEREGVRVRRPEEISHHEGFSTPTFSVKFGHAQACPRDSLLVIGDCVIEVPMAQRARYFEYRAYRKLVKQYFYSGARWVSAPRPELTDDTYTPRYTTEDKAFDFANHPSLTEFEPCFDAASFARCGYDIFWQPDVVSNQFGIDWLQSYLGDSYRIHRVEFEDQYPQHIDTTLVPLRPGLAMINPGRPFKNSMANLFKASDWQLIDALPSVRTGPPTARDVSNWISMNILVLDPSTIVAEAAETPLIELFKRHDFDVITCEFDGVFKFGGSFHCCTLDIRRRGDLKRYFG